VLLHIVLVVTNGGSGLLGPEALFRMGRATFLFTQISVIVFNGRAAVVLFFVLSGFVLSIGFDEAKRLDGGIYVRFLVRRAFRLFPALWVTIVLSVLVGYFLVGQTYSARSIASYFLLVDLSFAPPAWTLVYEIAVCIIYPFMFFAIRQQTVAMQAVALAGISWFSSYWPVVIHYGQLQGEFPLFAFFLGICAPTVGQEMILRLRRCRGVLGVLAIALIFAPESLRWYADFHPQIARYITMPAAEFDSQFGCFYLLSWIAFGKPRLATILAKRPCTAIGRWSYSIYVLHGPVLWAVTALYGYLGGSMARLVLSMTALSMTVPLTIAASALNYAYVERPFIDLGRRVTSRTWILKMWSMKPVDPN
jgi:peptidoglycan/LPS O-acetylase OafA/YrhL